MATNNNFKQSLDNSLQGLVLSEESKTRILQAAQKDTAAPPCKRKAPIRLRKVLLSASAAVLLLAFGVAAAAAVFPSFESFLSGAGEDLRQLVRPINAETTHDGIAMEVVAAVNDGDNAIVYLTLQDTTGQGRVDASTEIANVNMSSSFFSTTKQMFFDETTSTATFCLEGSAENTLLGQKVTLGVDTLLSGREYVENANTGLTLLDVQNANPTPVVVNAASETAYQVVLNPENPLSAEGTHDLIAASPSVLSADNPNIETPALTWLHITSSGIVQNNLHIQVDNTSAGRFTDAKFQLAYPDALQNEPLLSYTKVGHGDEYRDLDTWYPAYEEHIMELPADIPLEEIYITASGFVFENEIEGRWEVTFRWDDKPQTKTAASPLHFGDCLIEDITASSTGLTFYVNGNTSQELFTDNVQVVLANGDTVPLASTSVTATEGGGFKHGFIFARPVALDDIEQVIIGEEQVFFTSTAAGAQRPAVFICNSQV